MALGQIACCDRISGDTGSGKVAGVCGCHSVSIVTARLNYEIAMLGWYEGDDPSAGINRTAPWKTFRNYAISPESGFSTYQSPIEDCDGVSYREDDASISGSFNSYVEDNGSFTETGSRFFPVSWTEKFCSGPFFDPPLTVITTDSSYTDTQIEASYRNGFNPQPATGAWDNSLQYWEAVDPALRVEHTLSDEDTELLAEKRTFFQDPGTVTDDRGAAVWGDPEDSAWNAPNGNNKTGTSYWMSRSATATTVEWERQFLFYYLLCEGLTVGFNYRVELDIKRRTITKGSSGIGQHESLSGAWVGAYEDVSTSPYNFTATATTENIEGTDYQGIYIKLGNLRGWEYVIFGATIERVI